MGIGGSDEFSFGSWKEVSRCYCTIVCGWKEIGIWIAVWMLTILVSWVSYELIIVDSVFWGAIAGPLGILGFLIVAILVLVIFLAVLLGFSILHDQVWTSLKNKLSDCWQVCRPRSGDLDVY